jgi:transcriptional regulator with PAS, ATPase and Fis domain
MAAMQPRISVLSGSRAGEVFLLEDGDLVLEPYCKVTATEIGADLRLLGSSNGVLVNSHPVLRTTSLWHGDRIRVGDTEFVFAVSEAYFQDTPEPDSQPTVITPMSALRMLLLESARALRNLRDTQMVRERLLDLMFSITPAKRAAVYIDNTLTGRNRDESPQCFAVSRGIVDRVLKDGEAILSNDNGNSIICVPLDAFENRIGVIYADASTADDALNGIHLNLLMGVAAISALVFEHTAYIEQLRAENARLTADLDLKHEVVGSSPPIVQLQQVISKVAPTNSNVLIQGESGTGKELVARAIHKNSTRSAGPFVAINCAALPEELLESELFGHEKGAFTTAVAQKKGEFEMAAGGTLFLDEIGELSMATQAKLLRAIQEREIKRIGGTKPIRIDIRLIAATNRNIEEAIAGGTFREDLYYRLNVVSVKTPPLRRRPEDIPALVRHFVQRYQKEMRRPVRGINRDAERMLMEYDWPGNVRQLQNVIERAFVLGSSDMILVEDLPDELFERSFAADGLPKFQEAVNAYKRDLVQKALNRAEGDHKQAAALLGLNPTSIYRLVHNLRLTHLLKSAQA